MYFELVHRILKSGIDEMGATWAFERERNKKPYVDPIELLYAKVDMVEKFLETVSATLKDCYIVTEGRKIVFPIYDDETITIGMQCKDRSENFLVDSDFIYKRFCKLHSSSDYHLDYSELFKFGVLKPYKRFYRKPLYRLKIEGKSYRSYFCIPMSHIDVDAYDMKWI